MFCKLIFKTWQQLCSGTTSAIFHIEGYVDVNREQLIISVTGSNITPSGSLINWIFILSAPGALFDGLFRIILLTSSGVIVLNSNRSRDWCLEDGKAVVIWKLLTSASFFTLSTAVVPTEAKYSLIHRLILCGLFGKWFYLSLCSADTP